MPLRRRAPGNSSRVYDKRNCASARALQAHCRPAAFEPAIADAAKLYPQVKPERIKSIIAAESNFDPNAVSPVGAEGLMQLMPGTSQEMGVKNPLNPEENVRGGTRYYAQMLTRYGGDERRALAAYNWGPGNLDKVGGDVSKAPPETQAYVAKVLGGGGVRTARAQAPNPRIAELDRLINQKGKIAELVSLSGNEASATQFHRNVMLLVDERKRLQDEDRRIQERAAEIPQASRERAGPWAGEAGDGAATSTPAHVPEDRRKLLTGLRTDIRSEPTFKIYQDVRNGYQNVQVGAERDDAQGD